MNWMSMLTFWKDYTILNRQKSKIIIYYFISTKNNNKAFRIKKNNQDTGIFRKVDNVQKNQNDLGNQIVPSEGNTENRRYIKTSNIFRVQLTKSRMPDSNKQSVLNFINDNNNKIETDNNVISAGDDVEMK